MKTEIDPIRWSASNELAPEPLRAAFAAASSEGPSIAQMRKLAVKLAAVSAGTAVATSAATAHAGTGVAGASTAAGTLPLAKLIAAVAVVGATTLGGVALFVKPATVPSASTRPTTHGTAHAIRVDDALHGDDGRHPGPSDLAAQEPQKQRRTGREPVVSARAESADRAVAVPHAAPAAPSAASVPAARRALRTEGSADVRDRAPRGGVTQAARVESVGVAAKAHGARKAVRASTLPSEVELLRLARAALAESPRESFALTEQHRGHYPRGVFAQERDALAIEALLRSGETEAARALARSFVKAHPSSPHAHRFRETLGLR